MSLIELLAQVVLFASQNTTELQVTSRPEGPLPLIGELVMQLFSWPHLLQTTPKISLLLSAII